MAKVAFFDPEWTLELKAVGYGEWRLIVINTGSLFSAFAPARIKAFSQGAHRVSDIRLTALGNANLNPGERVEFELKIDLESSSWDIDWNAVKGGPPIIDLWISFLGLNDYAVRTISLELPLWEPDRVAS